MPENFGAYQLVIDYSLIIGNNQWLINWLPIDYPLIIHWCHWCHWLGTSAFIHSCCFWKSVLLLLLFSLRFSCIFCVIWPLWENALVVTGIRSQARQLAFLAAFSSKRGPNQMKKYEAMLTAKLKAACKNGLADVIKYKTEATQVS